MFPVSSSLWLHGHYHTASLVSRAERKTRQVAFVMVKIIILVVLVVLVGGAVILATWDMPAPTTTIEKVIPNERFNS